VRRAALEEVGGWRIDTLTEDTDLTVRLVVAGWEVVYENRAECYEEVPESWLVRTRQIDRWARGHNEVMWRYIAAFMRAPLPLRQRIDGVMLLAIYLIPPLMLLSWIMAIALLYLDRPSALPTLAVLAIACYSTLGNFAAFFEIVAALRLDGDRRRVRLLPFVAVGFLVSLITVSLAAIPKVHFRNGPRPAHPQWNKTPRGRLEGSWGLSM
jgi:cellulose synthase/poly-beta-1,6-N-acetylglucosamine synthase-like glycosyltransferase